MFCGDCDFGTAEQVVGNGITESPYIWLIRCEFDNELYHYPDDECTQYKFAREGKMDEN